MNDTDFEAYLALLAGFLRLNARQRTEIRRELRAHLEEAIEEAIDAGVPREEAVLRALEDFGDAAELAGRFNQLGRKRRWIMRGTAAAACIGLAVVLVNVMTPDSAPTVAVGADLRAGNWVFQEDELAVVDQMEGGEEDVHRALERVIPEMRFHETPFETVVEFLGDLLEINTHVRWEQLEDWGVVRDVPITVNLKNVRVEVALELILEQMGAGNLDYEILGNVLVISGGSAAPAELDEADAEIYAALQRDVPEVRFEETPISDVFAYFRELLQVNIHVQWVQLDENGIDRDRLVSVQLSGLPVERVLRLVLDEVGGSDIELDYEVREGVLLISTRDALSRRLTTRVHNIRELLDAAEAWQRVQGEDVARRPETAGISAGGGGGGMPDGSGARGGRGPLGGQAAGRSAMGGMMIETPEPVAERLLDILFTLVEPESWQENGGVAHADVFSGILVVYQTERVHRQIEVFLDDLRREGLD